MWITGQVFDDWGRALADVTVEALGPPGVSRRVAISNAGGHYVFQDLRPGTYTITFSHSGFSPLCRHTDKLDTLVATINAHLQSIVLRRPAS
jgi:protocatechuate 3,4-dioxygenase beta subunit